MTRRNAANKFRGKKRDQIFYRIFFMAAKLLVRFVQSRWERCVRVRVCACGCGCASASASVCASACACESMCKCESVLRLGMRLWVGVWVNVRVRRRVIVTRRKGERQTDCLERERERKRGKDLELKRIKISRDRKQMNECMKEGMGKIKVKSRQNTCVCMLVCLCVCKSERERVYWLTGLKFMQQILQLCHNKLAIFLHFLAYFMLYAPSAGCFSTKIFALPSTLWPCASLPHALSSLLWNFVRTINFLSHIGQVINPVMLRYSRTS